MNSEPYYNILVAGGGAADAEFFRKRVATRGVINAFAHFPNKGEAVTAAAQAPIRVGKQAGCLLVFWFIESSATLPAAVSQPIESPQAVGFAVTAGSGEVSFATRTELIAHNFISVATVEETLATLDRWCCGPPDVATLAQLFVKRPERWLQELKHDFICNGLLADPRSRPLLEAHGLWELQCNIDHVSNVLANVLAVPFGPSLGPGLRTVDLCTSDFYRTVCETDTCLVVPDRLKETVATVFDPEDFLTYAADAAIPARLAAAAAAKSAPILLHDPSLEADSAWVDAAQPFRLARVWISPEPHSLPFEAWSVAHRDNVLASYTDRELVLPVVGRGAPLTLRRPYWRACAHATLAEIFERLANALATTARGLATLDDAERLCSKARSALFMVEAARQLYCPVPDQSTSRPQPPPLTEDR